VTNSATAPTAARSWLPFWSVALLLAINLLNYIDRFVLAAVVPKIESQFGTGSGVTGLLSTAFMLSYMCAAPVFGWLADRYSRWLLVSLGVIVWSIASGLSGLADGITVMLLTRIFVGVGEAAYGPAAPTIISDLYAVERRGRVMACFYAAIPVGSALGFLLGGLVLKLGYSWHWAFFVVVPPGIVVGIAALFLRDPPRRQSAPGTPAVKGLAVYRELLRTPSYVFTTIGMTAMTFAMGGIAFWMPKYIVWRQWLDGVLDVSAETNLLGSAAMVFHSLAAGVGTTWPLLARVMTTAVQDTASLAAANQVFGPIVVASGLSGTLLGGWTGDFLRRKIRGSYFIVSAVMMALAFPLVYGITASPFAYLWYLTFAACFCLFFNTGPTNTILANVTRAPIRAAGYAINIFVIHALGDAISPPLIGVINDAAGGNMNRGFLAVSFAILVSSVLWFIGSRFLDADTAKVEALEHPAANA